MSVLSNTIIGADDDSQAPPNVQMTPGPMPSVPQPQQPTLAPQPNQPSRLTSTLAAIVSAATNGIAGIPDKGRPSFVTGLGQGARAEQAAQAQAFQKQQQLKFSDL